MKARWTNFTADQVAAIVAIPLKIGVDERPHRCPACGEVTLRWYSYLSTGRPAAALTYVWCSSCRRFHSERTSPPLAPLPDPLSKVVPGERAKLEASLDRFLEVLDELWAGGSLPQVLAE